MSDTITSVRMPILALRGLAVFPEQTVHFDIEVLEIDPALEA